MGTMKTAEGKTTGWRLGNNAKFMAWVKAEAERLAVPRLDIATNENVSDLRILFVALYPYEFLRFEVSNETESKSALTFFLPIAEGR